MAIKKIEMYSLSIKQPWATLVVHGLKTIEIRRWQTGLSGRILIHTGRFADDRPAAWKHVPKHLLPSTELRGGIVGSVELHECLAYHSLEAFDKDRGRHLNEPGWFIGPEMFGFRMKKPEVVPFWSTPGQVRFFRVTMPKPPRKRRLVIPPGT